MNPEITVLMSVYNDQKYLKECLDSIISQSFSNFEFLIIDDASTDKSYEILEEYAKNDKRIKLIKNKVNKGLSYNLAEGVLMSRSPWIARMDADDISFNTRLEQQIEYIKQHPNTDVVGSYVIDIDEKGEEIELRKVPTSHEKIVNLIWTCPIIHPSVLFKRDAIIHAGSYDTKLRRRQDYDLWFRCVVSDLKFANIDQALLYYRFTEDYYQKNNIKVQWNQLMIGIKGVRLVKLNKLIYIALVLAFIKNSLPTPLRKKTTSLLKIIDPRRK